ncbi:MAG: bifunctional hydroxymethylpyrimidine kinase/phosphomethylpyrimidine kinase [Desulfobacterales bacterium]
MKIALTIAGSDPSGGAGIQADLKTFHAHGVYGVSAITAVTVQNTQRVYDSQEISAQIVHDQIVRLFEDMDIDAVKIGMIPGIPLIEAIADALGKVTLPPVVLDPVMRSTSGYDLLKPDGKDALVRNLFPMADVVTPNVYEAGSLTGKMIATPDDMKTAARDIIAMGAGNVVIKGGDLESDHATDLLYDGSQFRTLNSPKIVTSNTHGTGCTFSSAIAAHMARGKDFFDATAAAKTYVTGAIKHALAIGRGHGPTHHFFDLYAKGGLES